MIKIKAIILAAGYGTRLYPLTKDMPKPLLEVSGKPIIEHILFKVEKISSVDKIFIVTNDKFFSDFAKWEKNFKSNKKIKIINDNTTSNEDRLGAIGDINFVIKKEGIDDDLLIIGGDNLFEFSLLNLHRFFNNKKSSVIALYDILNKNTAAKKLGVASIDENSKIIDFEEKPESPKTSIISTACYIMAKDHLKLLKECIKNDITDNLGEFIGWLSKNQDVYGHVFTDKWYDIGSFEQLEKARKEFKGDI